jgi:hypothetical protein
MRKPTNEGDHEEDRRVIFRSGLLKFDSVSMNSYDNSKQRLTSCVAWR